MAGISVRHRPSVLFNLICVLLIVGGIGITIYGLAYAVQIMHGFDPFRGDGPPVKIADGMALAFWGFITFTVGRCFWLGARKRGLRDRFGRFLIISGYALLGVALHTGVHSAAGLWSARTEESRQCSRRPIFRVARMFLSMVGSVLGRQPVPIGNRWYYG